MSHGLIAGLQGVIEYLFGPPPPSLPYCDADEDGDSPCHFFKLPVEIICDILSYLNVHELCSVALVNRKLSKLCESDAIWTVSLSYISTIIILFKFFSFPFFSCIAQDLAMIPPMNI